ncbi:peptide deformylase [Fontivita pretiosa]|uniref:peptide deformylase n=1 Tax=Fontivita pretiosa TaxID=2989684 RepID=UPI003D182396
MFEHLRIINYPDPRLKKVSQPVTEFTPALKQLAARMFELMAEARGVGLAAPQVGQNIRLFVMNPTGKPDDAKVYVNPVLSDVDAAQETAEEGCLSLPNVNAQITRIRTILMQAQDLEGNTFHETQSGYIARIWQHETDHLNGILIIDRMGLGDKLKHRRVLRELEQAWERQHPQARKKLPQR